ncbi:hypothetical protein TNCV_1950281 [Trichonephila clavipes]|nr:hypothetical protein TNCV_1950281 [Trichonephila clavipes]
MSCSKVLISQGLDPFSFHRKVHTVVTAKNLSDASASFHWIFEKSVGVTMLHRFYILRQNHALEVGGPIWQAFLEGSFKFMSQHKRKRWSVTTVKCFPNIRPKFVGSPYDGKTFFCGGIILFGFCQSSRSVCYNFLDIILNLY